MTRNQGSTARQIGRRSVVFPLCLIVIYIGFFCTVEYRLHHIEVLKEQLNTIANYEYQVASEVLAPKAISAERVFDGIFLAGICMAPFLPLMLLRSIGVWPPWFPGRELNPKGIIFWQFIGILGLAMIIEGARGLIAPIGLANVEAENLKRSFRSSIEFARSIPPPPQSAPQQIPPHLEFNPSRALMLNMQSPLYSSPWETSDLLRMEFGSVVPLCNPKIGPQTDDEVDVLIVETNRWSRESAIYGPNGNWVRDRMVEVPYFTDNWLLSIYDARTHALLAGTIIQGKGPDMPEAIQEKDPPKYPYAPTIPQSEANSWIFRALGRPESLRNCLASTANN